MKKVGVAILGLGTVGGGTYRIITEHREFYQKTQDIDLDVECVLELNKDRIAALGVPAEKVAANIAEVVSNPNVDIVVEMIGGIGVARTFVQAALNAGKSVVTSNKELIAKYSYELEHIARRKNCGLYYEASCVGGVPIIRTLLDGLQANCILSMMGIVNGTTNYILDKMTNEGASYEEVLKQAQALGYAELDPTSDVEGFDSTYKLSILSSMAFHTKIPYTKIYREGITTISQEDIAYGKELGYVIKLLAIGKNTPSGIEVRVHPTYVRNNHPLASVNDAFNAVYITGDAVDDVMLYGRGAGDLPTGSAVVSDVIFAATHSDIKYSTFKNTANADKQTKFVSNFSSAYYLRMTVNDKVGTLGKIATIFARQNVSIGEMIQKDCDENGNVTLIFITHETKEQSIKTAVSKIASLENVCKVDSLLRVVS
ncbi:MAG: homoserine dehydrogenase [Clostridia bacterium]|nr:homoserine dehydrogenase [Clostridia bacterium]